MYYLSIRTIDLLAELGDSDCKWIKNNDCVNPNGFIARHGVIKQGPVYECPVINEEIKKKRRRMNGPTFRDWVIATPLCRPE